MSMSQSAKSNKDPDLGQAIRQLESLLDSQPEMTLDDDERLPVLDEVVQSDDEFVTNPADAFTVSSPSQAQQLEPAVVRTALERIAGHFDTELARVSDELKQRMIAECKDEMAAALNMDPETLEQQLDGNPPARTNEQDKTP